MNSSGLVDCQACLDREIERLPEYLDEVEKACVLKIISLLNDAGSHGIAKKDLLVSGSRAYSQFAKVLMPSGFQSRVQAPDHIDVYGAIDKVTSRRAPLFFWAGYLSVVLVSSAYLQAWSLVTPTSLVMVKPRRWIDIDGSQVLEMWEAGLRVAMGTIVSRPAITQVC